MVPLPSQLLVVLDSINVCWVTKRKREDRRRGSTLGNLCIKLEVGQVRCSATGKSNKVIRSAGTDLEVQAWTDG